VSFVSWIPDNSAPLILAIDTATRAGSVALARGAKVLSLQTGDKETSHSVDLISTVEAALESIGAKLNDVELFAAASGPGSFTGLRIGLASIKSFAVSSGRRCVGVPTLAAIAHAAGTSAHTVALLPAGRGEVFAQVFSVDGDGVRPLDNPAHLSPAAVLEKYSTTEKLVWAGEGAHSYSRAIGERAKATGLGWTEPGSRSDSEAMGWMLAPRCDELAGSIAALAHDEYRAGRTTSPDELRAIYVRPSDAEINERWQAEKSPAPLPRS
jgi:tRNA threonylcarbamoyladenosine biosynthesis protein TsaB